MLKISLTAILSRYRVDVVPASRIGYISRITLMPHPTVPVVLRDATEAPRATRIKGAIHQLVELQD